MQAYETLSTSDNIPISVSIYCLFNDNNGFGANHSVHQSTNPILSFPSGDDFLSTIPAAIML